MNLFEIYLKDSIQFFEDRFILEEGVYWAYTTDEK